MIVSKLLLFKAREIICNLWANNLIKTFVVFIKKAEKYTRQLLPSDLLTYRGVVKLSNQTVRY